MRRVKLVSVREMSMAVSTMNAKLAVAYSSTSATSLMDIGVDMLIPRPTYLVETVNALGFMVEEVGLPTLINYSTKFLKCDIPQ